jgi:hypothetical protein
MTESIWVRAAGYSAVAVVAAASWAVAQTIVDSNRAKLPIAAYIDCLEKFATIEWPASPDRLDSVLSPNPSGSAVCKELSSRRKAD